MKCYRFSEWFAATVFAVTASTTHGQSAPSDDKRNTAGEEPSRITEQLHITEVIVTARRTAERLIDVPQTVNAVTSEDLLKQNILTFEDLNSVVAGLNLEAGSLGYDAGVGVRGISYDPTSGTGSPVQGYINEVPVNLNSMFQAMFDIGQIEILRGPQGTLRGRSAPTGAFTLTTRRPNLYKMGGYISVTESSPEGTNVQGAVGVPIVEDMLGVRVAGVFDRNRADNIKSVNNPDDPEARSNALRASVLFQPTSEFSATLMYQNQRFRSKTYGPIVFGEGAPAFAFAGFPPFLPALEIPAGFNGPALTPNDRKSVVDFPNLLRQNYETFTGQAEWTLGGLELDYVGGIVRDRFIHHSDVDPYNIQPNKGDGFTETKGRSMSHEVRLNSLDPVGGFADYTIGYFYSEGRSSGETLFALGGGLPGAFGPPSGPLSPVNLNRDYAYSPFFPSKSSNEEQGIFGSTTLHFGDRTDMTIGARQIWREEVTEAPFSTRDTLLAFESAGPCTGVASGIVPGFGTAYTDAPVSGSPYPGTCSVLLSEGNGLVPFFASLPRTKSNWNPFVYDLSLSHRFTPDLMVYATYGTSWRSGPQGIIGAPVCDNCDQFSFLKPEKSKSIELGVKGTLLDQKLTFSIAAYNQEYENFVSRVDNVPYRQCLESGVCVLPQPVSLTYNAPVNVRGVDLEVGYTVNENLNLGTAFSYARSRFDDASIPCRDSNFDGIPDENPAPATPDEWVARGGPGSGPAFCTGSGPASALAPWNFLLHGEYAPQITATTRGFLRSTYNYTPRNKNKESLNADFVPKGYGLLDLIVGFRSVDNTWEVSLSAKNVLNDDTVLDRSTNEASFPVAPFSLFGASTGYRSITFVPRREYQLSVRYAFGSD